MVDERRGFAGSCGERFGQHGDAEGWSEDDAGEVCGVDVGRVEEPVDCAGDLVEEGLRGGRDVVTGDDGGWAGRGQQDRCLVLGREQTSGGPNRFQENAPVARFIAPGCGHRRSERVGVDGCHRDDALGDEVVEALVEADLSCREFAVAVGSGLQDGEGRRFAVCLADQHAGACRHGAAEHCGVGGEGGGCGDQSRWWKPCAGCCLVDVSAAAWSPARWDGDGERGDRPVGVDGSVMGDVAQHGGEQIHRVGLRRVDTVGGPAEEVSRVTDEPVVGRQRHRGRGVEAEVDLPRRADRGAGRHDEATVDEDGDLQAVAADSGRDGRRAEVDRQHSAPAWHEGQSRR